MAETRQVLTQRQKDKCKLYALHAPEVEGISKGQARRPYEFGVKVSITTPHKKGLGVGARSMPGNPYEGHTLEEALEQAAIRGERRPAVAAVDRGYGGVAIPGATIYPCYYVSTSIIEVLASQARRDSRPQSQS